MILKVSPSKLSGSIQAPSSKSLSQRFIALSLLASTPSILIDISESDDCTSAIAMAAELGALSVCDDDILCKAVRDYGRKLGRAFQIQDDILELYASEIEMGKSLDSDVLLGKKTYPILKARELNETKIQKAFDVVSEDVKKGKKIIRDVLEMEGIKQDTLKKVREMIDDANAQLTNIGIHSEQLLSFSEMIAKRNN